MAKPCGVSTPPVGGIAALDLYLTTAPVLMHATTPLGAAPFE
jgi:hypothetical protein